MPQQHPERETKITGEALKKGEAPRVFDLIFHLADSSQFDSRDAFRVGAMAQNSSGQEQFTRMAYSLFPILEQRRLQPAGTLSGGQQKMLSLARGLAALA